MNLALSLVLLRFLLFFRLTQALTEVSTQASQSSIYDDVRLLFLCILPSTCGEYDLYESDFFICLIVQNSTIDAMRPNNWNSKTLR